MSTQKPTPRGKDEPSGQRDDLDLGAELVKDLEPTERTATQIAGGRSSSIASGGGGTGT